LARGSGTGILMVGNLIGQTPMRLLALTEVEQWPSANYRFLAAFFVPFVFGLFEPAFFAAFFPPFLVAMTISSLEKDLDSSQLADVRTGFIRKIDA
jgi:hypothetical protein